MTGRHELSQPLRDLADGVPISGTDDVIAFIYGTLAAAGLLRDEPCCRTSSVRIEGHWVVEQHTHHTCGAGDGLYGHEPGCGLVPLVDLSSLDGWDALVTEMREDDHG